MRFRLVLLLAALTPTSVAAQTEKPKSKSTFLGAPCRPVPEVLRSQLPQLQTHGIVIETVPTKSWAARIGIRRHDVLLRIDAQKIRDLKHLSKVVARSQTDQSRKLTLLRAGRETLLTCNFAKADVASIPKSAAKNTGPPAVRFIAEPLKRKGAYKVTLTWYADNSKQDSFTCTGTSKEIDAKVRQMARSRLPLPVRDLVDAALMGFHKLNRK